MISFNNNNNTGSLVIIAWEYKTFLGYDNLTF
jgi:hypothetical protein